MPWKHPPNRTREKRAKRIRHEPDTNPTRGDNTPNALFHFFVQIFLRFRGVFFFFFLPLHHIPFYFLNLFYSFQHFCLTSYDFISIHQYTCITKVQLQAYFFKHSNTFFLLQFQNQIKYKFLCSANI